MQSEVSLAVVLQWSFQGVPMCCFGFFTVSFHGKTNVGSLFWLSYYVYFMQRVNVTAPYHIILEISVGNILCLDKFFCKLILKIYRKNKIIFFIY